MRHTQHGTSLVELLVACAILAAGVVGTLRLHGDLRLHAELSRQRHEAVRLAQQDLERLRGFSTVQAWQNDTVATTVTDAGGDLASATTFALTRQVREAAVPTARQITVAVTWSDRAGRPQRLALDSVIAGLAPAHAGALTLDAGRSAVQRPLGRSPRIPVAARDLGDGRSVLKPAVAGSTAIVLDNETGALVARCSGLAAGTRTQDLGAAQVAGCSPLAGMLLAGEIRRSATTPPSPGESTVTAPPVSVAVSVDGTPAEPPVCVTEDRKTVRVAGAGGLRVEAVPVDATPAFLGVAAWTDTGERHTAYACTVTPPSGAATWSGQASVAAAGLRSCRYATDLDHSGAIDLPIEHGATYRAVSTSLTHQNLLLVNAGDSCPVAAPVTITGSSSDVFADLSTAP